MKLVRFKMTIMMTIFAILVLVFAMFLTTPKIEKDLRSTYLKAGDFALYKGDTLVRLSDFKGRPVLLYFGYTYCPDVCPVGLSIIRDVLNLDAQFEDIPALFITLDPDRDTPHRLLEYTQFFHKNIIGVRGSKEEIKKVSDAYGASFRLAGSPDEENYTVDHSAYYYLIDKKGLLIRVVDHDAGVDEIADLLHKLL